MKKFTGLLFAALLLAVSSHAIEPVSTQGGRPESRYSISQSTITLSSTTVTTIAALTSYNGVIEGYRRVLLKDLSETTSFFYRLDGSTQNIVTVGMLGKATDTTTIETSGAIYLQLAVGVANKVFNVLTFQK